MPFSVWDCALIIVKPETVIPNGQKRRQSRESSVPEYNKNNGKDHWSISSIMFMGRGIQGNRVIGATDERQFLVPIDPALSTDKENGIRVRPEHIHAALRNLPKLIRRVGTIGRP